MNQPYILSMLINMLVLCVIALKILPLNTIKTKLLIIIMVILCSIYVPVYLGFNILYLMRGVLSGLSVTTGFIAFLYIIKNLFKLEVKIFSKLVAGIIFIFASLLYLSAFDFLPVDIYDLGFIPSVELLGILGLVLLILYKYNRVIAWVWLLAFVGFYFKVQASMNLFDYLVDPILWFISILFLIGIV